MAVTHNQMVCNKRFITDENTTIGDIHHYDSNYAASG